MRRTATVLLALTSFVAAWAFWGLSCRSPTEVTVQITTDEPCSAVQGTSITVGSGIDVETKQPLTITTDCNNGNIGSIVIVPSGSNSDAFSVRVVAGIDVPPDQCETQGDGGPAYNGCIVARRVLSFLPHTPLTLPIAMRQNCKNVPCGADQTCVQGNCFSSHITNPGACQGSGCGEGVLTDGGLDAGGCPRTVGGGACLTVTSVSAGGNHTCALVSDQTLRCWGSNSSGELGVSPPSMAVGRPVAVPGVAGVQDFDLEGATTCALLGDGSIRCWGDNSFGELGPQGPMGSSVTPVVVNGLPAVPATEIVVAASSVCALLQDQSVWCWGKNSDGQLGASGPNSPMPINAITANQGVTAIDASGSHACALFQDGTVKCWGSNDTGESGQAPSLVPVVPATAVAGVSGATAIALGFHHSCALVSSGIACWGFEGDGELGNGALQDAGVQMPQAVQILSGTMPSSLVAGDRVTCAWSPMDVQCWGSGTGEQLGVIPANGACCEPSPIAFPGLTGVQQLTLGAAHGCALLMNGTVECWGDDFYGQLGTGTGPKRTMPQPVEW